MMKIWHRICINSKLQSYIECRRLLDGKTEGGHKMTEMNKAKALELTKRVCGYIEADGLSEADKKAIHGPSGHLAFFRNHL